MLALKFINSMIRLIAAGFQLKTAIPARSQSFSFR